MPNVSSEVRINQDMSLNSKEIELDIKAIFIRKNYLTVYLFYKLLKKFNRIIEKSFHFCDGNHTTTFFRKYN